MFKYCDKLFYINNQGGGSVSVFIEMVLGDRIDKIRRYIFTVLNTPENYCSSVHGVYRAILSILEEK